ncbi:ATP-binding protein [Streptomyces sp. NPDC090022]|uniref:sensor histidine kinase n=1 Tax=Streptomyces sp. NPDC090022 TaxID=3365920 RepID=UPI0037F95A3C
MSGLRAARHAPSRHTVTGPGRQIRPQLVRAAVLPTLAAGLSGAAAVIFALQLGHGPGGPDARLWPVLTGCGLLVVGALAAALLGAQRAAKAVHDRCEALRRSSVRGRQELRTAAERLERGESPARVVRTPSGPPPADARPGVDEFWLLSQELRGAREHAQATLARLAGPAAPSDSEQKVEVFVNLARRLQSLVHREISLLDELEDTVEDPDLLKELFHIDHLATRIRRHAENLAVLGGAASRRQWTRPIDLSEVLRSSVAEVEQYTRVKVVPPAGGTVRGHAVADVVHLLAELVENATVFSAPDTDVVVRAERVTAGIAVEVEDRGLGMPVDEQHRMNALLGDPDQVSVKHLLADGRIGLFVVSSLARRHGIAVELKSNIYGGVLAVLVLPQELLGADVPVGADAVGGSRATTWGTATTPPPSPPPLLEPVRVPLPPSAAPAAPAAPVTPAPPTAADPVAPTVADPPLPRRIPRTRTVPAGGPQRRAYAEPQPQPGPGPEPEQGPERWPAPASEPGAAPVPAPGVEPDAPLWPATAPASVRDPGPALPRRAPATRPGPAAGPDRRAASDPGPSGPSGPSGPGRYGAGGPALGRGPDPVDPDAGRTRATPEARCDMAPPVFWGADPGTAALAAAAEALGPVPPSASVAAPGPGLAWAAVPEDRVPERLAPEASAPEVLVPREPVPEASVPEALVPREPVPEVFVPREPVPETSVPHASRPDPVPQAGPSWAPAEARIPAARESAEGVPIPGAAGSRDRGDDERPPLPRRRAQTHIVPQLLEAPVPRPPVVGEQPLHDPGLMAAFQRGFGLAQTENQS